MSEEQLERSILERKASDELRAIATAMSLEPVARTRKADLVNQILRAAGVEVDEASAARAQNGGEAAPEVAKPARARTSRSRSASKNPPGTAPAGEPRICSKS